MAALTGIEKVEANDDMLMAILIQLPPKSIFKFRCVSNRWNNIINGSFFLQSYTDKRKKEQTNWRDRLVAFIQSTPDVIDYDPPRITILPTTESTKYMMKYKVPSGKIINCSNGLILFGHQRASSTTINLHILNPLTGKSIVLPPPTLNKAIFGLVCEENTYELVTDYRVVAASVIPYQDMDNTLLIETYSSKTRNWEKSTLIGTENFALVYYNEPPIVFNGVFHWHGAGEYLAVYDSNSGGQNNHVQLIKLPYDPESESTICSRSTNDDVLWYGVNFRNFMKFWMLPKTGKNGYRRSTTIPKAEWILMHTISYDDVMKSFVWEALIPWNPFVVVMRVEKNKVLLYNVVTKSIELVKYHGRSLGHSYWTPYMESLSLSTYALSEPADQ